jgi:Mor family transcriptional regulator
MKYKNAAALLPKELLSELQKYAQGELIYIPNKQQKAAWGTLNGSRERYAVRNMQMLHHYSKGASIEEIANQFYLSKDSIRKIIKAHSSQLPQF